MDYRQYVKDTSFAILLASTCMSAQAFAPNGAAATLSGGFYHEEMTRLALDEIYAAYDYGPRGTKSYTRNMRATRSVMGKENADVDRNTVTKSDAIWHCDGDIFLNRCSDNVKNTIQVAIDNIKYGDMERARVLVGRANHTLQDFYSHSNWVEMNGAVVNPYMGKSHFPNVAPEDEDTCVDTTTICSGNNLATRFLTSGYFLDSSGAPKAGVRKCFHGGYWDDLGNNGINKDTTNCWLAGIYVSPHHDSHNAAARAAIAATVILFNDIKSQVDEGQFKAFLGFGPSLGFAIDTTGSMATEINGVKNTVSRIVNRRLGTNEEPSRYVLSIINDPIVPPAIVTANHLEFLEALNRLYAGYGGNGGDCPELSGLGTYKAVVGLDQGGTVFMYTDASAKDPHNVLGAAMLAISKKINIVSALSGSCSPYDPAYFELADLTGGQVFIIQRSEAGELAELANILSDSRAVGIMTIGDSLSTGAHSHDFYVDSVTDSVSIAVSIANSATVGIFNPSGVAVTPTDPGVTRIVLSSAVIYQITDPQQGQWKVSIQGSGDYTLNIAGTSEMSLEEFNYVTYDGRPGHMGYFPISGYPIAGQPQSIQAILSGNITDTAFEFRTKAGELITAVPLNRYETHLNDETRYFGENIVLPSQPFIVYAKGKDQNGVSYQRVLSNKVVPQQVSVTAPPAIGLQQGKETAYTFRVTNLGPAYSFTFSALDDRDYVVSTTPAAATIAQGKHLDVKVVVKPPMNSKVGTVSTLIFTAIAAPSTDRKELIGNYAVLESSVVETAKLGDVNHDGLVDCLDIMLINRGMGNKAGDEGFNPALDLNNDGVINVKDLSIASRNIDPGVKCGR